MLMVFFHVSVLSRFSRVPLFLTLWTITLQAPQSMGSSRQEYMSGLPCPPPGDLPNPGIEPAFPALQMDSFLLSYYSVCVCVCVCVCTRARAQSCLTLCVSVDCSQTGSSVLSLEFPGQEYWSGLPFPTRGDLPDPGLEPMSLVSLELSGGFFTTAPPGKPWYSLYQNVFNFLLLLII